MSSNVDKEDLIAALRLRYDYYSAQTIFDAARERAELPDQPQYSASELAAFRQALGGVGDRLAAVEARLESLVDAEPEAAGPMKARAEAAKAESKPEAKPEPKAEAKPEPKAEAKPEPKPEPKAEPKAEAKPEPKSEAKPEPKSEAKPSKTQTAPGMSAKPVEPPDEAPGLNLATVVLVGLELDPGEQVMVCGSFVDWNPERAVAMARVGDTWQALLPVAVGDEIAFKFLRRKPDGAFAWEHGDDRKLVGKRHDAKWGPR